MLVSRRTALKQVLVVSAGLAILPSCFRKPAPASMKLKNISLDANDEKVFAAFADTLIPKTSTPGAVEVGAHTFALTMIDDCFKKEDRQKWSDSLKAFNQLCKNKFSKTFDACSPEQRAEILTTLDSAKSGQDNATHFYHTSKNLIITGYTKSQYYLSKVQVWELIPQKYYGSIPVKDISKRTA
jgi:hypothetical protein